MKVDRDLGYNGSTNKEDHMGATTFEVVATGETADKAFNKARAEARQQFGSGGYTGTIAEKSQFVSIAVPPGVDPRHHAQDLIDKEDRRVNDKWGPAGCIKLGPNEWLFFGWASE